MQNDKLLKLSDVEQTIKLKKDFIYNNIKKGTFPKPIKIENSSRWKMSEVQKWVEQLQ